VEGIIHGEEFVVAAGRGNFHTLKVHALLTAAVTQGAFAAGFVNENAAHGLGRGTEELSAASEVWIRVAHQPQPGLMHERGGLQRLLGRFVRFGLGPCRRPGYSIRFNTTSQPVESGAFPPSTSISRGESGCVRFRTGSPFPINETSTCVPSTSATPILHLSLRATVSDPFLGIARGLRLTSK
jgi:hypothetical protein